MSLRALNQLLSQRKEFAKSPSLNHVRNKHQADAAGCESRKVGSKNGDRVGPWMSNCDCESFAFRIVSGKFKLLEDCFAILRVIEKYPSRGGAHSQALSRAVGHRRRHGAAIDEKQTAPARFRHPRG